MAKEYIEREALLKHKTLIPGFIGEYVHVHRIIEAPAADAAPVRHGKWEECDYIEPCVHGFGTIRHTNAGLKCSNCVNVFKKDLLWKRNYCPNCGARMDGEHIGDVNKM